MRIILCCNHTWPHVGGSEKVVQQISEAMAAEPYRHEVIVLSRSIPKSLTHNGVSYQLCAASGDAFIKQLQKLNPGHTHIYSDCFAFWPDLLKSPEKVPGTKSCALVGMNFTLSRTNLIGDLKGKQDQIRCITHSDNYQDYQTCFNEQIAVTVIPNGVDLAEFDNTPPYVLPGTEGKKVVLCVSTFFPGKGQEFLVEVLKRLYQKRQDWCFVNCSNRVNFAFAQFLSDRVKKLLKSAPFENHFQVDLSREKVVGLFKSSRAFAFPSQKEVAPLVAIESQAAGIPWVALPVGNVPQLKGGLIAAPGVKDIQGYLRYCEESYETFAGHLDRLLGDDALRSQLAHAGREQVEQVYNWQKIAEQYNGVFTK
jgi:glycosyltransferase involved in cell wall biosynthesis